MCGFKGRAVMSSGINDTARCAPATARITAVNWVCNGAVFQARVWKEPTKSRIQSYLSALLESRERMCSHYCSLLPLYGERSGQERQERRLSFFWFSRATKWTRQVKNTNTQPRVQILTFHFCFLWMERCIMGFQKGISTFLAAAHELYLFPVIW